MRWANLSASAAELPFGVDEAAPAAQPLPLALPGAVVRTFDTPGFAGMTFYEIHAKSIINRVPAVSRVPFEWTINPYRGCSHACSYCLSGETPILMADGRTKALAELRRGDKIYGTVRRGNYRRYVITEVLAHWQTIKSAYRVLLADGSQIVASGDHRFLTERGWMHVTGRMAGPGQWPYLTTGNKLIGVGQFAGQPKDTPDYRRGYLCGMIRGDAHLGSYAYPHGTLHCFRLALADPEALGRSHGYLADFGVPTKEFEFRSSARRPMRAIRTSTGAGVERIRDVIRWPTPRSDDWCKGFLAGVFDAEGSCSRGVLRISNRDQEIIDQTAIALGRLGFTCTVEQGDVATGVRTVRLVGGLRERLRFFHAVDPAIDRKRSIAGTALKSDARLGVVAVEPLGLDVPMYDLTTGTGDFIANGVVSHNCYARNTHTYLDLDAGHDFDSKVIVKVNAGQLLRRELSAPKWRGEHIAMGTNVDCYQRAEGKYRLMREILAALRDFTNPFSILTKGTLILRDLDLLRQAREVAHVGVSFSVGFVDEALWRSVESGTPSPRRRLDAVRTLTEAGFEVGVLMAPILPGLTDTDESIEATIAAIAGSGAVSATPIPLHLRPGAREWYRAWLAATHPELVGRYDQLYRRGSYLPKAYQQEVTDRVKEVARRHGLGRRTPAQARQGPDAEAPPPPEQLTLL
ncbi:MAG TPA: intein-containing Rv2578c family radical SAM protein [Micromonosporaceae bacterium]